MSLKKILIAAAIAAAAQSAHAVEFTVNSYTANSVTFTIDGTMPGVNPGTLADGPEEIDIRYTGNIWAAGNAYSANALSADPISGAGGLQVGNTGGFGLSDNYSWMYFSNDLTGRSGTGTAVTLTWGGSNYLNTAGTGTMELYWGNLQGGVDASGARNVLLDTVSIVNGRIVGNDVPEPASLALFGASLAALTLARRRKRAA